MAVERERTSDDDRLSVDTIYELLAARKRRYLLYALYRRDTPIYLPDVVDQLIEWEHGVPGEARPNERLDAYMELYHAHIPKLSDVDVVVYSQADDEVELGPNASQLRAHLEHASEKDFDSHEPSPL